MMKSILVILFSLMWVSCLSSSSDSECLTDCTADTPNIPNPATGWGEPLNYARVFASGHSLMDNPLVDYLEDISNKKSDDFDYNQQIVIGSPIRVRTAGMAGNFTTWPGYSEGKNRNGSTGLNVVSELRNPQTLGAGENYDTLVLTENHSIMGMIVWEQTVELVRHYHDVFIEGHSSGRTLLYHSWLNVNKADPQPWINHEKNSETIWECVASKVNLSLADDLRADRIKLLPAGGALVALVESAIAGNISGITGTTEQKLDMIFSDNVHLTQLGQYFISTVVYSAVYRKAPTGVTPPTGSGILDATAADLQALAWSYVSNYYGETAGSNERTMSECRELMVNSYCESYYNGLGESSSSAAQNCRNLNSNANDSNNYFIWPDANFSPYSTPQ